MTICQREITAIIYKMSRHFSLYPDPSSYNLRNNSAFEKCVQCTPALCDRYWR